jgi:ABC-type iron transport system FetAB permease component
MADFEKALHKKDRWPQAVALVVGLLMVAFVLSRVTYVTDSRVFFAIWMVIAVIAIGSRMTSDARPAPRDLGR